MAGSPLFSQTSTELEDVRVDELTDEQIRRFIVEADKQGLNDEQIEAYASDRGMNSIEIVKFKDRVQSVRKSMGTGYAQQPKPSTRAAASARLSDSLSTAEQQPLNQFNPFSAIKSRNFGADVFNNQRLTFEPNLRLPTPVNYTLAADDELLIDVSGYSEASYSLKVSPEGTIRIPNVGPVFVSGLSIEQAKRAITRRLATTIYRNINTGNTFVSVSLGQIRSIKVTIIGEATLPGTYTLPSLATAYNALYACGGPNENGSFRNIQVVRNNRVIATIDVYQYLVNGSKKNDVRLADQDVIKINTYDTRVELKGEVKKPGLYDVAPGESLRQILSYAGGFTDNAYTARIQVFQNTSRDRRVTTVTEAAFTSMMPGRGDTYIIGKILNRFTNRISIRGAVYRPGEYELREGMTLRQLIEEADGLREDAFMSRAVLHRLKDDLSPEIRSFSVDALLRGDSADIPLRREDRVTIYSKFDLKEGYYVSIEGEVSSPGIFLYEEGIGVEDLVVMSGGLKEAASVQRIEVSRRVKDGNPDSANTKTAVIFQQDIRWDLRDTSAMRRFRLEPFDQVTIRPAPGYFVQRNAVIEGEVIYTGKYTLETKSDRISDLVKRSGGLTPQAYIRGAVLVRTRNLTRTEQANAEQGLNNLVKRSYENPTSTAILLNDIQENSTRTSDIIGIDLKRILEEPRSAYDLLLNDGDTLRIPKQLQTIRVNGEVLYPTLVRYNTGKGFKHYIFGAGGFSERASRKKSYVVYPNGSVKGTGSFLFFKFYPKLTAGAEIYVPARRPRQPLRTGEIITIASTLVTMAVLLINVLE